MKWRIVGFVPDTYDAEMMEIIIAESYIKDSMIRMWNLMKDNYSGEYFEFQDEYGKKERHMGNRPYAQFDREDV